MPGPKCSVCDLDSSIVGVLETVHTMKADKAGNLKKISMFACAYCKENHLDVHDENASA